MNPRTVQKLLENIPEVRELIDFLVSERDKLNDLSAIDIAQCDAERIALDVKGRAYAKIVIDTMLAPLLGAVDKPFGTDPKEYVVE